MTDAAYATTPRPSDSGPWAMARSLVARGLPISAVSRQTGLATIDLAGAFSPPPRPSFSSPVEAVNPGLPRPPRRVATAKPRLPIEAVKPRMTLLGSRPTAQRLMALIEWYYGVTREDMVGICRKHWIVRPRQMAFFMVREFRPDLSLPEIGRLYGGRDHTTIIHGIRATRARIESAPEVSEEAAGVRRVISERISVAVEDQIIAAEAEAKRQLEADARYSYRWNAEG